MDHRQWDSLMVRGASRTGRSVGRRFCAAVVALSSILAGLGKCTAVAEPLTAPPQVVEGPIEYVGPDTYIMLDTEGRPQPVLGMKYEDFVAAWKESQHLQSQATEPRFVIESLDFDGQVREDRAELVGKLNVRQLVDGPLAVPLGMAAAILHDKPTCRTIDGEASSAADDKQKEKADEIAFVDYDRRQGGFLAHLEGVKGGRYEISLPMFVPLARDGSETSLRLNLPRSVVGQLVLKMDTPVGATTVSAGSTLTKAAEVRGATQFTVAGLASDFQLTWSPVERQRAELATVLSAVGNELITIDGHSIRTDARLTIRSFGGSFDRCRIRLPPDAQLIENRAADTSAAPPKYSLSLIDEGSASESPSESSREARIATVAFPQKQSGPVDIDIATEQPLGDVGSDRSLVLSGFELIGAARQYGDVAVRVADDWEPRWEFGESVRQVERTDLPANLQQQPSAAFQYDRQPWSLRARLERRPLRVHVTPEYDLNLVADGAELRVHLNYQLPGARAFEFRVQLNGWQLMAEPIDSGGLVDQDRVIVTRDGVLVLPLGQASSRRADVSFKLRRALARDATRLELPLPAPEADTVGVGELVVVSAPDLDLLPDMSRSKNLSPTPVTADSPPTAYADGRQVFRFRSLLPEATFAAEHVERKREISWKIATRLDFDRRALHATQTLDAFVRYLPLEQLRLDVPEDWSIIDDQVEILPLDALGHDQAADARGSGAQANSEPNSEAAQTIAPVSIVGVASHGTQEMLVTLPQPRLGRFALRVKYLARLPDEAVSAGRLRLLLPRPVEGSISGQDLRIAGSSGISVQVDAHAAQSKWKSMASGAESPGESGELEVTTSEPRASVPLVIRTADRAGPQPATVERVWLETWVAGNSVQDRAAFRFASGGPSVTVELPPQALTQEIETLLDGHVADVSSRREGRLAIAIPDWAKTDKASAPLHTLELRYRHPRESGVVVWQHLTPPQLVGTSPLSLAYWELVLPADEQLVEAPGQLVSLDRWQWLGTFWGRRPMMTQTDLETWVGAVSQPAPSARQAQYLFSGFAPVATIEVLIVPRWLIVLVIGVVVLLVGAAWLYLPHTQRLWIGMTLALVVAGLAIAFPIPAVLVGQASLLGLLAVAIAILLRRGRRPSASRRSVGVGSTQVRIRASTNLDSAATPPVTATPSAAPVGQIQGSEARQ
jgi:hypothetical protein